MKIKSNHAIFEWSGIDNSDDFQNWITSCAFIKIYLILIILKNRKIMIE